MAESLATVQQTAAEILNAILPRDPVECAPLLNPPAVVRVSAPAAPRTAKLMSVPFMHKPEARRAVRQVLEDRISNRKRPRVSRERFERLSVRASVARWVWIVLERGLLHLPEDLFLREFGGLFACH